MRGRLALAGLLACACSSIAALAWAAPPDEAGAWDEEEGIDAFDTEGFEPEALLPSEPGSEQGMWLSLELIGPRGAQIDAGRAVATPPVIEALPRGVSVPGELVGRVETLEQALEWVAAHVFAPIDEREDATPIPGGSLLANYGVVVTALVVTGPIPSGATAYPWPPANALPLPASISSSETPWRPASLAAARVPVFAAPAPTLPPASERYQVALIDDSLWLLGTRDACSDDGRCLSWAQVVVRHGDRFFGGWIPSTQVIPDDAWVSGPGERRLALLPGHRDREQVGFALIEQRDQRREAPIGLRHAHVAPSWPQAAVEVLGEELVVLIGGESKLTRHLETTPLLLRP